MRFPIWVILLALLPLVGCYASNATTGASPASPARTGEPNVVIQGTTRKVVADAIAARVIPNGWIVTKSGDYLMEVEKKATGAMGFFGNLGSPGSAMVDPIYRITFSTLESPDGVRLSATMALVQSPHTGNENPIRLNNKKQTADLWALLESLDAELERAPLPPDSTTSGR